MSMIDTSRQFDDATMHLLASVRGCTLRSYIGYLPFEDSEHLYKMARLDFGGFTLDLVNAHEPLVIGPEYEEEQFATLSVQLNGTRELWHPEGRALTCRAIDFNVTDVLVVVDTVLLTRGSRRLNRLKLAQAVIFENKAGNLLSFDRDIWSDEYLAVREGNSVSTTTRDFRGDFVAEPPFAYQFGRDIVRLSNPGSPA